MSATPKKYAVALFEGFQALDVFGPLDILNLLSKTLPLELSVIGPTLEPVSTLLNAPPGRISQKVVPTHTYDNAPDDIEVLIVPGGQGTRDLGNTRVVEEFIKARYPKLRYFLTVCTGGAVAARAGVLDGREATSNKRSFSWVSSHSVCFLVYRLTFTQVVTQGPKVNWHREARWVEDGNIWTSSGISAGIDMTFAFVERQYGRDIADDVTRSSEYVRNKDPKVDPFAAMAE